MLLADETDEAWADLYSCAISFQNAFPRASVQSLVGGLGAASVVLALVFDVTRYEDFLLLIGAVFVPLFGVLAADYFVVWRGYYAPAAVLGATGAGGVVPGVRWQGGSPGRWASAPTCGSRAGLSRSGWPGSRRSGRPSRASGSRRRSISP